LLIGTDGFVGFRDSVFSRWGQLRSEWVDLEEGKSYFLEGRHKETSGNDHMTVAVEIEQEEEADYFELRHEVVKESQDIEFYPVQIFEESIIEITDPDEGEFVIAFLCSRTLNYTMSGFLKADASAHQMWEAVKDFFWEEYGAGVGVTKHF